MNDEDKEEIIKLAKESVEDGTESKREAKKLVKDLKIITAISIGKDRNKELAKVLDTDKSFAAKKVKDLEQRGLVHKEGSGKETRYRLDVFNVMKFLQSRVIITTKKQVKKEKPKQEEAKKEETITNTETEKVLEENKKKEVES